MNKLCYRIVFNKARGICMAVQETARSRAKAPGQTAVGSSTVATRRMPALSRMAFMLGTGLGGMAFADVVLAQIVADPKAPGQQQATVLNTANGVLQVNIQTPSAAGVSRNVYSQFDVPTSGAILNNSRTNAQTQLGGWVQGNPWLTAGTARVILNEVNSSNPSHLQGYIEVAGDRAETVIANPAGIVVNGGGFINVSRATLTTGSPMLEDGRIKGYAVQRGQILIDGAGLDASRTDYTALIARSLQINAGIWAQRLNVIAGVNQVDEAEQATVTQTGQASDTQPLFAIDVARLGGMYANQIYLVGTEAGVGVRNAGGIGASAGDLIVTASGRLENSGTLSASQRAQINVPGIENRGTVQAEGTLALTTGGLVNAGHIVSGGEALIAVQGDVDNSGGHIEAARIDLTGATIRNTQGTIVQTGTSALAIESSQTINTGGVIGHANISLSSTDSGAAKPAPDSSGTAGSTGAGTSPAAPQSDAGAPPASTPTPVLADGQLKAQLVDNTAGLIASNGGLVVHTGALDSHDGHIYVNSLSVTGPVFENTGGDLTVLHGLEAHADNMVNDQGKLLVGGAFSGTFGSFSNRQGLLQADSLSVDVTGQMDNSAGTLRQLGTAVAVLNIGGQMTMEKATLESAAGMSLRAGAISGSNSTVDVFGDFSIDGGVTSAAYGRWTVGGDASFHISSLDNTGGMLSVAHTLNVTTGSLTNTGGTLAAGTDVVVAASAPVDNSGGTIQAVRDVVMKTSGAVLNQGGSIEALSGSSSLSLTAATIDNGAGRIANAGSGRTSLAADRILNGGQIGGNGSVDITARMLSNTAAGSIGSQGDLDLTAFDKLDNAGQIASGGRLWLEASAAQLHNQGALLAHSDIEISAASIDNTSGTIATAAGSGGQVSLRAQSLENRGGLIQADGASALDVQGGVDNEAGHIGSGGQLSLKAGDRIENRNGSIEANGRMLVHGGEIGNDGGVITAAGTDASVIEADRAIDNSGLIGANGQLTVRAATLNNAATGTVSASGDLELAIAARLSNNGGSINTAGALNFDQAQAGLINSGVITAARGAHLNLDLVDNRGGAINTMQGASLELSANTLDNQAGRLMAGGDATVQVRGDADNTGGVLQSAGSIDAKVDGALRNQDGVIEALGVHGSLALGAAAIDNTRGRIVGVGDGATNVSTAGHIANSGVIAGNGEVNVAASAIDNTGLLSSGAHMELAVSSALNNSGTISAAAGLHTNQASAVLKNSGAIVASGPLDLTVASLENIGGQIGTTEGSHANVLLSAQHFGNQGGAVMAERDLVISVKADLDSSNGLLQAKGQLQLSAGGLLNVSGGSINALSTDSSLHLHAGELLNEGGRIVNAGIGDSRISVDAALTNSGQIAGKGALGVEAAAVLNKAGGSIVAGDALALQAHASLENAGMISSGTTLIMDEAGAALVNHGTMVANGDMALHASTIDNGGGTLATANGSNASLSLMGTSLSNHDGIIIAERNMVVNVDGALDNSNGRIAGGSAVQVASVTTITNYGGVIEATGAGATLTLHAEGIRNGGGQIVNVGQGGATISAINSVDNNGLIGANGALVLHAETLVNEANGIVTSGGTMKTDVGTLFDNAGIVNSGATLQIAAQTAEVRNSGTLGANGALNLVSATLDNTGGQLGSSKGSDADVQVQATSISNRGGFILSDRDAFVNSAGMFDNEHGTLQASGALQLDAGGRITNVAGVIEALGPSAHLSIHAGALDNGDGRIVNVGGDTSSLTVASKLSNRGLVAGNGILDLNVGELENQVDGSVAAGSSLHIEASRAIANAGTISAHDGLTVDASKASFGNGGQIVSGNGAVIDAASFDNRGGQLATVKDQGGGIVLRAGAVANSGGDIVADGALQIEAGGTVDNHQGVMHANTSVAIHAGGDLKNQAGVVEAVGSDATLALRANSLDNSAGRIANVGTGTTVIAASGGIVNSGTLAGNGSMDLSANAVENQASGAIAAGAGLDLHVGQVLENAGIISANGALVMDQAAARISNSGQIAVGRNISLHGASIVNDGGQIGTLAGADIVLTSESTLSNRGGLISASGNAAINVQSAYDNSQGAVQAAGHLQVTTGGSLINAGGTLEAVSTAGMLDLNAASIDNTAGRIVNAGTGHTNIAGAAGIVNSGTIGGNGALAISTLSLQNTHEGTVGSGAALELDVHEQLVNAGTIASGGSLHVNQAAARLTNSGLMGAGSGIDITAATINNSGGQLYTGSGSGAAIKLRTGSLDNSGGMLSADGLLDTQISGTMGNNDGTLHGGSGTTVYAGGALTNGSGIIENLSGALQIQAQSIDSRGRIVNAGTGQTNIVSTAAINNSGTIAGNGTLAVSGQTLQNDSLGTIGSGADLELAVREQLTNAGTITSGGHLHLNQVSAGLANRGIMGAGGSIDLTASTIDNSSGQLYTANGSGGTVNLRTGSLNNASGMVSADGELSADVGGSLNNDGGVLHGGTGVKLNAGGALTNGTGSIESASGTLAIQAQSIGSSGRIIDAGTGQMTIASSTDIVNSGTIAGNGGLLLSALGLRNTSTGAVGSGTELGLQLQEQLVNAGTISSGGRLQFDQVSASLSNTGIMASAGAIAITAATINNSSGQLYTANSSGAAISLHTGSLDNSNGVVSAEGLLSADVSGSVGNDAGTLHGGAGVKLNVGGALANGNGIIESATGTLAIQTQSLDSSGRIVNAGTGPTNVTSMSSIVNSGTIAGNGAFTLSARMLQNDSGGTIGSGAELELGVGEQLTNAGSVTSAGHLHFDQASAILTNSGRMGAGGAIDIMASTVNNSGGQLYSANSSGAAINLRAGSLDNADGLISADGVLSADVTGDTRNNGGTLHGGAGTTLTISGALANGSGTIENVVGALAIQAQSIETSGRVVNAGTGQTTIASTAGVVNSGIVAGNGRLVIAAQTLQNASGGAIGSGTDLELEVGQQLGNAGSITSGGELRFNQASASLINSGRIGTGGVIDITASTIDNRGGLLYTAHNSNAGIALHSGSLDNANGTVSADGVLDMQISGNVANQGGALQGGAGTILMVGGALANGSGMIESGAGTLAIQAQSIDSSGHIVNAGTGQSTIVSTAGIVNSGIIAGNGALDLHAPALQNQAGGQIASGGSLLLDLPQQLNNAGTISSGGSLRFEQAGASFANSGQLAAAGDIRLTAASFDNRGGEISTVRGSGADIMVAAPALDNRGGAIIADGDAVLAFTSIVDNSGGTLQAGRNLALSTYGTISNDGGTITTLGGASSLTVSGSAIDNGSGRISNAGTGDTRLISQTSINNGGVIAGMGNVLLSAQSLSNLTGAQIASGGNLELAITQQVTNQGKIDSGGTLHFEQTGATLTNSGELFAGGDAVINASMVNNDGGHLGTVDGSGASLMLTTPQLSNQGGRIATDGDISINTHTVAALGEVFGGRDLTLAMDGDYEQGGGDQQFHANRNLSLTVTGNITNTSTFQAGGTLTLTGQQISNQAGASIEGKGVVLRANGDLANAGEINGVDAVDISAANISNSGGIVGGIVTVAADNLDNTGSTALIGATNAFGLNVAGTLNNTGGATLYSSGDMVVGGRNSASAGAVNNISSTIEAAGDLAINASSLSNVRENVQIVKVKTVDETVHMTMPSWYQYGDNHNAFETSAANYSPHEVYFVNPSDILDDQVYVTPDGNTIHRALVRTHANDSAFYVASSGLYGAYGDQSRLTLSEGTRVIYYTERAQVGNPDQGASASNAIVDAGSVTHWASTVSFSNQYGNCSSDCIRLVTQPDYSDPDTTIVRDTMRALAPVKEQLEVSRDAHYTAVEDQLAPGTGANAQILSGGNMYLTVSGAIENKFGEIKAKGVLVNESNAPINNVGATLYRTYNFDGTWTTYGGQTVAYQQPSLSEVIGSAAGVVEGDQGVIISARSINNIDITAGTVGNIRDTVNVIGSGAGGASMAGAHVTASAHDNGPAGAKAAVGTGNGGVADLHLAASAGSGGAKRILALAGDGADDTAGAHIAAGAGVAGTVGESVEASASGANVGLLGAVVSARSGSELRARPTAVAGGMANQLQGSEHVAGDAYVNGTTASSDIAPSGTTNGLATNGMAHQSGASNDASLSGSVSTTRNGIRLGNVSTGAGPSRGQQAAAVQGAEMSNVTKVAPSGLFVLNPDANGSYVFETRPEFANQQQWTSSDYMLRQLAMDPTVTQKRLGDGFYEQRIVREQLAELTGHASGSGVSDDDEYKLLLTNGVSFAQEYNLRPGVSLSAEQVSHLTSDIVWMESQTVMLPDGRTETVLAPKVYLAHVDKHNLQPGGALVTGNGVQINTTESIVNTGGVIDGGKGGTLLVAGQDIVNRGGTIKGDWVALSAQRDVKNESLAVTQAYDFKQNSGSYTSLSNQASITATGALDIQAGRDLSDLAGMISAGSATLTAGRNISFGTIQTGSTYQSQISGYTEKDSSITHQLSQISTGGDLKMAATGDLSLAGTKIAIGTAGSGNGQLLAGGTINIAAVTNEVNTSVQNDPASKQYDKQIHANQTLVGADVAASGGLTVGAGLINRGAINITASSLTAADALKLTATDSVNIVSAQESHLSDTALTRSSSSFMKSKTTQQADYVASSQAIGSALSGKTVDINAGKDINVLGSAIAGDGDVNLTAVGSVNIGASTSTLTEQHHMQVKESGFLSGNGFGFSIGTRTTTTDQTRDSTTQSGQSRSMVGSIGGNLNVNAGSSITIAGSDINAGHDIILAGTSVAITPGVDNVNGKFASKMTQDGLTLALGGSVVNAIQTVPTMSSAAAQVSSGRFKALAAAAAAATVKDTADDLAKNGPSVKVSLTVGHSESESTEMTASSTHGGSMLSAGNNVTISAAGGGKASNIDIVGSDVRAKGNVSLAADNQVNLLAAQDTESQHSQSKSLSAAVGVAAEISSSGAKYGLTASASASRGNIDGEGTTQVNSHVSAGDRLTIASGGDTNLKGAVASGNQVVTDIKGNLNIESLQDKATLDGKRQSVSVSGTVGAGGGFSASFSQSTLHNDYASVQEQSALRAGGGGFQVQVAGNTDLKGGVISSSEQAIKDGRNSLATGTLSFSDVQNHSSTDASGISLGVNVGKNQSGSTYSPSMAPGMGKVSGSQESVTRSGVSGGALTVAGQPAEQAVASLNRDVSTDKDTVHALTKGWNGAQALDEVGAQMQITSAAMPRLAKGIGDYAASKAAELNQQGNPEEAAKWAEGGIYRVAAHAALGALGGGLNGAVGAAAAAEAAPTMDKLQNALQDKLAGAGLSNNAAGVAAKLIAGGAAATIGGVVGGGSGAATALNADMNNRQLHPEERNVAEKLAAASHGKYTEAQIEAAMRAGGNIKLGESVTAGMVVPLTADTSAKELYDATGMLLSKPGDGRTYLVQQISTQVDPELAAYIRANTGGAASPYTWEPSVLGVKPPAAPVAVMNPFMANSSGCVTAECAAGVPETRNHTPGETRFLGILQATAGAGQAIGGSTLVAAGLSSCPETAGFGCIVAAVGGFEMAAGWDNVKTGTKTGLDAKPYATTGGELLQRIGFSPDGSELLYGVIQGGSYGGAKLGVAKNLLAVPGNSSELINAVRIEGNFSRDADMTTGLRPAADINKLFAERGYDSPFTDGTYTNVSIATPGTRANMVVSDGQGKALDAGKPAIGSFATPDLVPDQAYARGTLAITPSMKLDVSRVVAVETTGKAMVQIEGKVAPQAPASIYFGDGNQLFFDYPAGSVPTDYVKPLGPTTPLPVLRIPNANISYPVIGKPVISN